MIVIDSSALIAILRREPEADGFLQIIAEAVSCLLYLGEPAGNQHGAGRTHR